MTVHQQQLMQIFVREGYHPKGAAAVDGAVSGESGASLDTTVFRQHADHDSGGIAEWRLDRKANMQKFCIARGKPVTDFESQCMFIIHELSTDPRYSVLNPELIAGQKTVETMCWNFVKIYERPNMAVAHMDDIRVPAATKCLNDYTVAQRAKGAVVVGGAAGGGAVVAGTSGAPISVTVASALVWAISWILSALAPQPKKDGVSTIHVIDPPIQPTALLTPLERFKRDDATAKNALVQRQKSLDELKAAAEELNQIISQEVITIIDHAPSSQQPKLEVKTNE
jgi:hypothetical protein